MDVIAKVTFILRRVGRLVYTWEAHVSKTARRRTPDLEKRHGPARTDRGTEKRTTPEPNVRPGRSRRRPSRPSASPSASRTACLRPALQANLRAPHLWETSPRFPEISPQFPVHNPRQMHLINDRITLIYERVPRTR